VYHRLYRIVFHTCTIFYFGHDNRLKHGFDKWFQLFFTWERSCCHATFNIVSIGKKNSFFYQTLFITARKSTSQVGLLSFSENRQYTQNVCANCLGHRLLVLSSPPFLCLVGLVIVPIWQQRGVTCDDRLVQK
jgi:hypothetical protein